MTSLLDTYESEFKTTYDRGVQLLSSINLTSGNSNNNNIVLKQVENFKDDLIELIQQMELEVNSIGNTAIKIKNKTKIRNYKDQLTKNIKIPLDKLTNDNLNNQNRDELLSLNDSDNNINSEQRQQLLQSQQILSKSSNKLRDASQIANETEGIGAEIMLDLRSQRETLENARQTLFQADGYVDKSIKTLKTMTRRLLANKFISYAIIAALVLLILLVLYSKF
ncbi:v-SNARE protein VTI1 SCDLUD_001186 [Saccharomycodes ludwigii]|uniref:v-SNARE protein VTI1 n=1 Tax=Saccharomycodes ludwigii TaxID=36035 RepID=UPI001E8930E4|nr:hypothetical protein SCDLUD_001186 [Saccharomycodes ludwigii]KAH3903544.1 hypothetical protein SCDLUD_001186 [Saccharomycodes ludwigii]